MPGTAKHGTTRGEAINLRISTTQRTLIDQAAEVLGRSRSDFMLDTVCREATSVLLDQRLFLLGAPAYKRFTQALDRPPAESPRLRRLLASQSPWK